MKYKRCEYGHYYDPSKYVSCPHCDVRDRQEATMALYEEAEPAESASATMIDDDQPTQASYAKDAAVQPPVGYLICLRGPARGQDFRLCAGRNTIGRALNMDVSIRGDLGISRESNAVLSYNPRNREFHLIPGEGKSIVYVDGGELMTPQQLTGGEIVEIGDTSLLFLSVCGPSFDWESEQ